MNTKARALRPLLNRLCQATLGAVLLHSGAASAIGLREAYQAALANDPTYRSAIYERDSGREAKVLGRAALLPNISGNYSTSKNRTDLEVKAANGATVPSHPVYISRNAMLNLRQPLFSLEGLARYKTGIAQSQYAEEVFTSHAQEMALRVVGAYLDALLASEQLALAQANSTTLVEQAKVNARFFEKGKGTKTDMLETQARVDFAEAQLIEAGDNEAAARIALSALVGQEVTSVDRIVDNFAVSKEQLDSLDNWRTIARTRNPELAAQALAIEVTRQEINRNRAGHAPRIDLVANYGKTDSESINTLNQEQKVRSIGVQVVVPLYAGGSVNAQTRQAVAASERAKADMQAKTDRIMLDLRKQYDLSISSASKINALNKAIASSKLLVEATRQSIKGGVRINLDLLNAQQQLYTSQRDLAQARFGYLLADLKLRAAAGVLGEDDIGRIAANFR